MTENTPCFFWAKVVLFSSLCCVLHNVVFLFLFNVMALSVCFFDIWVWLLFRYLSPLFLKPSIIKTSKNIYLLQKVNCLFFWNILQAIFPLILKMSLLWMAKGDFQIINEKKKICLWFLLMKLIVKLNWIYFFSVLPSVHYNDILYILRHINVF